MNADNKIIAGESFGVVLLAFQCADGRMAVCTADGCGGAAGRETGRVVGAESAGSESTAFAATVDPAVGTGPDATALDPLADGGYTAGDPVYAAAGPATTTLDSAARPATTTLDSAAGPTPDNPCCAAAPEPCEEADLTGVRIDCMLSTTPLGDRFHGSSDGGADFEIHRRAGEANVFFFNIAAVQSSRLSAGPLRLAFTFTGADWTAIAEIVAGQIEKLK